MPRRKTLVYKNCGSSTVTDFTNIVPPPVDSTDYTPFALNRSSVFRNSETEPSLAINPLNKHNIVSFVQQDRLYRGGALITRLQYSFDNGCTWKDSNLKTSIYADPNSPYYLPSDPWVVFGSNGVVHAMWIAAQVGTNPSIYHIPYSHSFDGGKTWSTPINASGDVPDNVPPIYIDKITFVVDPVNPNILYFTGSNVVNGVLGDDYGSGVIFTRSLDGGLTWEPTRNLFSYPAFNVDGLGYSLIGSQIAALSNGTLILVFGSSDSLDTNPNVYYLKSTDKGVTWTSTPTLISKMVFPSNVIATTQGNNPADYELKNPIRSANYIVNLSVSVDDIIYLTWQDARFNPVGMCGSVLVKSTDKGLTWSSPIPVNPTSLTVQAFLPQVTVVKNGNVAVSFYDFRYDIGSDKELTTDIWLAIFNKELTVRIQEVRITEESFDLRQAVFLGAGYFLGDYIGIDAHGKNGVGILSIQTNQLGVYPPFRIPSRDTVSIGNRQNTIYTLVKAKCRCDNICEIDMTHFITGEHVSNLHLQTYKIQNESELETESSLRERVDNN